MEKEIVIIGTNLDRKGRSDVNDNFELLETRIGKIGNDVEQSDPLGKYMKKANERWEI